MTIASTRETRDLLNGLIVACHDDIRVHDATARQVTGVRHDRLEDSSRRREAFVAELGQLVRELGGTPPREGSRVERVREWLHSARERVSGPHARDRYTQCARVEASTLARYEAALREELPEPIRVVVERQRASVSSDREELRRRSML